jgi:hypothetical protein
VIEDNKNCNKERMSEVEERKKERERGKIEERASKYRWREDE